MNRSIYYLTAILFVSILFTSCNRNTPRALRSIEDLYDCGLLVRLPDLDDKVEMLIKAQRPNKAAAVEQYNRQHNQEIIEAFKLDYSFSKVYFFLSGDTEKVKRQETDGIFLNDQLIIDPSIKLDCNNYLIMDYGEIEQDQATRISDQWVVKDQNFKPMQRPFPKSMIWGKRKNEIYLFNNKFHDFHESAVEKREEREQLEVEQEKLKGNL